MSNWPATLVQLKERGYVHRDSSQCASPDCKKIVFWFTTPKGHLMPMEIVAQPDPEAPLQYQPHFATCPDARKFSRKTSGEVERRSA